MSVSSRYDWSSNPNHPDNLSGDTKEPVAEHRNRLFSFVHNNLVRKSQIQLFEHTLWNSPDDSHNHPPDTRYIKYILTGVDRLYDRCGDPLYVREFLASLHAFGHGGLHRAGLDGHHADAFAVDAITQARQERIKAGFRRTVNVVRFAPAVAGNR